MELAIGFLLGVVFSAVAVVGLAFFLFGDRK